MVSKVSSSTTIFICVSGVEAICLQIIKLPNRFCLWSLQSKKKANYRRRVRRPQMLEHLHAEVQSKRECHNNQNPLYWMMKSKKRLHCTIQYAPASLFLISCGVMCSSQTPGCNTKQERVEDLTLAISTALKSGYFWTDRLDTVQSVRFLIPPSRPTDLPVVIGVQCNQRMNY